MKFVSTLALISGTSGLALTQTPIAYAEEETVKQQESLETIEILGKSDGMRTEAGSAHYIDNATLDQFKFDDIQRVLSSVPGVYFREEDGYGLRPNIGLRGTTTERSQKITLMEDAVLIGPAPYSAPAAYYFPMTARMTAVEVFKGPAAIQYGPYTVGGAVNLVTREVPWKEEAMVEASYGEFNYSKLHTYYGNRSDQVGWLIEGLRTNRRI